MGESVAASHAATSGSDSIHRLSAPRAASQRPAACRLDNHKPRKISSSGPPGGSTKVLTAWRSQSVASIGMPYFTCASSSRR